MILYKFRHYNTKESRSRTLEIINKRELYFASIKSFNDPFDGRVHLGFDGNLNEVRAAQIRTQYIEKLKKKQYEGITFEAAKDLVFGKITEEYLKDAQNISNRLERIQALHDRKGVLSLSSKNDNILMWSHYTFNHEGVCFGFGAQEIPFTRAKRVRYQSHYDDISAWLFTDQEIVDRILFSKALDWQYEDEYRIIKDSTGVEQFGAAALREVVFGSRMKETEKKEIMMECTDNGLTPEFKVASLDVSKYKLNITNI